MPNTVAERRIKSAANARGIKSVRTKTLAGGKYAHVYVVRKSGPNGGHTVMSVIQRKKRGK